jgi:peptidylprolyl isomerase
VTTPSGTRLRALPLLALVVVLGATGCSGQASSSSSTSASATPSVTPFNGVSVAGALGTEPTFTIGDTTQGTSSLQIQDVVVGTGAAATPTDKVTVQYVARSAKTKRPFDSSWARGKPYSYDPTTIAFKAFSEGVPGMKVGGRRLVIVPGPLAYGPTPPPSVSLGPNETLVFVIDLVSIDK